MIRIARCACPASHPILLMAYDSEGRSAQEAEMLLKLALMSRTIPAIGPQCPACNAPAGTWVFSDESTPTPFNNMLEAMEYIAGLEEAYQAASMELFRKKGH